MKKELLNNAKILCESIKKNKRQLYMSGFLIGWLTISGFNFYDLYESLEKTNEYNKTISERNEEIKENNDKALKESQNTCITVSNLESNTKPEYYFKDNKLYDKNNNLVSLTDNEKAIAFLSCKIDETTLNNINLSKSKTKEIVFKYSSVTDECIKCLPNTLEKINLDFCHYITNLNELSKTCPNIHYISINSASSLKDLSFIYNLPNLKEVHISNSAYINEDIIDYLNNNNIKHNLTDIDIENSKKIDSIIKEIIKPNMSDKEKIQRVCYYVLNTLEYDITRTRESNINPLNESLNNGKVVCASYAYFANVLLNKVGINSYQIVNHSHGWNMVEVDDKYYYIDLTNMDEEIYNFILKTCNTSKYYMIDTEGTFASSMTSSTNEKTLIPTSLIKDIENGRSKKDIFEKYGGVVSNISIYASIIFLSILTGTSPLALKELIVTSRDLCIDIIEDYKHIKSLKK